MIQTLLLQSSSDDLRFMALREVEVDKIYKISIKCDWNSVTEVTQRLLELCGFLILKTIKH